MIIRDYRPDDFLAIEQLWKDTGIYTLERGDTAEIILRCNAHGGRFLVMEDEVKKRVLGSSWLTWDGRRVLMHHFAISPSCQQKGYGRRLAIDSLAFAREKGAPMKLEVLRDNLPAVQLYKSLGFEVFEDYDIFMIIDPDRS